MKEPSKRELRKPLRRPTATGISVRPQATADCPLPGEGVELATPAQLLTAGRDIQAALNAHPELTPLLFLNPALVLQDLGFSLTDDARKHVLETLAQGSAISDGMEALEQELRAELGEQAEGLRFSSASHAARIVFELLQLPPLQTEGARVPYRQGPGSARFQTLRESAGRPRRKLRKLSARPVHGSKIGFPHYRAEVRYLDLEAELPELPEASEAPAELPPETLLFYRDAHPVIFKLLQYQVLHHSRLAFATGDTYRKVRDGEQGSVWRSWIRRVHYRPEEG